MAKNVASENLLLIDSQNQRFLSLNGQLQKLGYKPLGISEIPKERIVENLEIVVVHSSLLEGSGVDRFRKFLEIAGDFSTIFMIDSPSEFGSLNHVTERIYDYLLFPSSDSHLEHLLNIAFDRRRRYVLEKYYQGYLENQVNAQLKDIADKELMLLHSDRLSSIGQVTAGITHELKNPLMYMKLGMETLKEVHAEIEKILSEYGKEHPDYRFRGMDAHALGEEMISTAGSVGMGVDKLEAILRNISELSQKPMNIDNEFDLHQAISNTLNFVKAVNINFVKVEKDFCTAPPPIKGDPQRLEQLLLNLLINACHALESVERPMIHIATSRNNVDGNEYLTVSIRDNGPGISKEILETIFEPFFSTKSRNKGSGLGLSICRDIASTFSGSLVVKSEEGQGAEFVLSLRIGKEQ